MPVKLHNGGLIVFICFSHSDNRWRKLLMLHLKQLDRNHHVEFWSSPNIQLGAHWDEEIGKILQNAGAAILLVSPNFISSDYICNRELPLLLHREEGGEVEIIPVHAEKADVDGPFKYPDPESGPRHKLLTHFQSPSEPHNPLEAMTPYGRNEVLVKVARRIAALAPPKGPTPDERGWQEELSAISQEFLGSSTLHDLRRALFRAEEFLTKYPNNPEGRLLHEQILQAVGWEERRLVLSAIRKEFLSDNTLHNLQSVLYKAEGFLKQYPDEPEGRILHDKILEAIEWEKKRLDESERRRGILRRLVHSPRVLGILLIFTAVGFTSIAFPSLPARLVSYIRVTPTPTPAPDVKLRIIKPSEGETVGLSQQVWGETPYPTWNHYIIVRPLRYNCDGIVAAQAAVDGNGWSASAVFGQRNTDSGKQFKVFVLATEAQVPRGPLCGWPQGSQISAPVTVIRK